LTILVTEAQAEGDAAAQIALVLAVLQERQTLVAVAAVEAALVQVQVVRGVLALLL
jgi:hypothetical protein